MKVKKFLLVGGIVAVGLALVGGFGIAKKYMAYARQSMQEWADENTPPEQEIQRLKAEVGKLDDQENKIKNALAKEIAQCEKLEKEKATLDTAVTKEEEQVRALGEALKNAAADAKKVSVGKAELDKTAAIKKLDSETKAVAARKKELGMRNEALALRTAHKQTLREQLTELQAARSELASELDALELEYRSLDLKAMKTKNYKDDGKLSEVRQGISKLKDKVAEKRARVGLDDTKLDAAPTTESVDEMLSRLDK